MTMLVGVAAIAKEWMNPVHDHVSRPVDTLDASCGLQPSYTGTGQ